jgi:hypothetical protein
MSDGRAHGALSRLRPLPGREREVESHLSGWYRTAGRVLPGTRLHLLFDAPSGELIALHLFESTDAYRRAAASEAQQEWESLLARLLVEPPATTEVTVRWNAATDARPRVSVSIDRDVHATVQDLIGRLLERHPRTLGEDAYLNMLQSVAEEYERDFPATTPEEGELR